MRLKNKNMENQMNLQFENINNALPGAEQIDFNPPQAWYDSPDIPDFTPGLDPDYVKLLDHYQPIIEQYTIPFADDINSVYPNENNDTNPSGDPYKNSFDRIFNDPIPQTNEVSIADPIVFSAKKTQFDRYYNHRNFSKLGFHPYANNEDYYNANSTFFSDAARMLTQFAKLTGSSIRGNYRSFGDMFNSDPYTIPDVQTSDEFEKAMGIGMSSRGGLVGFSNNLFLNFGYTFGIIASIAAEELLLAGLTAATGGGAAPLAAAKTTANVGKAAKVVGKSVSNTFSMGRMANATRQLTQTLNQTDNARTFWQATKSGEWGLLGTLFLPETMAAVKKLQTAKTAGKSLSDIAKMSTMFGGFYREIRAINYAMSESKLESGFVLNQQIANGIAIEEQKKLKGLEPNLTLVGENAQKAAFSTTMMNFGLIYMTNKLILDTAFKGFNQTLTRNLNNSIEGVAGRVIRQNNIIGPDGKIIRDAYSDAGKGLRSTFNRIKATGAKGVSYATLNSSLRYFAANLGEGVQELGQEAISHGTKYYFSKLQENPLSGGADLYKASINKAVSSQVSGQGIETFLSGFLMGGLAKGPQKLIFEVLPNLKNRVLNTEEYKAYQEQKEKAVKELVEERNKSWNQFADDPIAYLEKHKNDFLIQNEVNSEMNEASYDGDTFKFIDAKDFGKFHHIYGLMQSGTVDLFKAELQDFLNLTDEELNEAFPTFKEEIKQGKLKQRVNDLIELVNKSESAYNKNKDVLVNPYDYNKYKKDTPEYRNELIKYSAFEHIRYLQMFTEDSFNRALERADKIYNELASDPILKKIQANDLTVLLDENSIKSEINLLKIEIENLDDSEESKKLKQEKQTKIEKLKKVSEVLNLKDNLKKDGSFDNRKVKNILEPLKEYVQFLADTRNDFVDPNRIKDVLKKITDHRALNKRAKANNRALQYLAVPENFDRVLERQIGINKNLFENNKKNVEDRIKKYIGVIEKNNLLNGLADLGVYPDAMEVEIFLIFNDTSILKTFYHEDGIVTKDSENLYKKIQNLIEVYNNISKDVTQEEESVTEPVENTTVKQEQKIEEGEKLDYDFVIELNKLSDNYHPVLKETLYRVYKESLNIASNANQNPQTLSEWQKTDLALNIIDTYKFLKSKWKETLSKNTADKSTIEGNFIKDVGLKDWLSFDTTKEDPDILNKNKENNTNILLYLDTPEVSYEEADVLKVLIKHKSDNYIVRILKTFANGGYINNYKIITKTGLELSDQLLSDSTIFNENGAIFSSLEDAKKAVEKLENKYHNNNLPVDFQYGGVTLFQGAYIFSGEKRFQVLSTPEKIKASNTLEIVSEDSEVITINSPEEFKKNYSIDKLDPIVKSDKVSRIRINDPIRYIPHENENETREEAVQRLDYIFSNLTPEQRKGLELVILENPESGTITEKEFTFTGKQPNSQLSRVSDKYIIGIRIADTVLRNEINAELNNSNFNISDSTEGIIAYLPNKNFIVYDAEGNVIDPRDIDLFTARNIFYKYNEEIDAADLEKIKNNFAIQANLIRLVDSKKTSSNLEEQIEEISKLPFKDRIPALINSGIIDSNLTFKLGRRFPVIVNIGGVKVPFYRSSSGTGGKQIGKWYPFFGFGKNKEGSLPWLIKGPISAMENYYNSEAIETYSNLLNKTLNWSTDLDRGKIENHPYFKVLSLAKDIFSFNEELYEKGDLEIFNDGESNTTEHINSKLKEINDNYSNQKTEGPLIITPEELENAGFYFNMTSRFFENEKESISPNSLDYNTIDGENIVIYDNRKQFFTNKKGEREFRRRKKTLSTIKFENGVNPASRHKEIEKELGKKLHEVARNKGAYVLVVKNKSDEYTLVELKPRKLDVDEFVSFVDTLIEQSEKTVNENLIEDTKKTAEKQDLRNSAYNVKFNDEQINNKIYIISKPDTIISLELDPRGRIEIQVLKYDNKTKKYEKQLKNKRGQNSAERIGFNEIIEAQEKIKAGEDKYNVYYDLFQTHFNNVNKRLKELGINVNITVDDIRKNISDEATVEEILNNTETNHSREVRKEYQITISQNDVDIQATKDVPLIVEAERKKRDSIEKEKSEVEIDEKASEEEVAELFGNLAEKIININNEIEDILTKERDTLTDKEVKFYEEKGNVINNFLNEKFFVSNLTKEYVDELSKEVDLISEQYRKEEKKLKSNELKEDEGIQETPPTQESGISVEEYLDKDTLNKKISELESKIKEKQKELIEKASSEGDITILNNNEELNNLKEELNGLLDKITSNKILKGVVLDEIDVENINVFLDWAAKNLPDYIDIKDLAVLGNNMKSGGVRVGAFALALSDIAGGMRVKGTLYTGAETPFRYHEAFHAIFRLLLTDEQQSKYLRLAAKEVRAKLRKEGVSFEKALNDFKNLTSEYQDLSRSDLVKLYYEEYLADQFELFKQSPTSTKTNPANKSFFARLIEWIKSFFSRFTKNELRRLYENIDSGKFKSSTPVVNRFTLAAEQGVTVEANALIPYEEINKKKKLYKTLDADAANAMIRSIAATYLQREEAFRISKVNYKDDDFEEKTRNEILDEVIKDYKELYNFTKPFNQDLSLELKIIMNDFYSAFLLFKDEIKEAVTTYLSLVDVKIDDSIYTYEEQEDDEGLRTVSDWDKDASNYGGWNSISSMLRKFIMTTTVEESNMFNHEEVKEGEKLIVPVDFAYAYNGILKATANTTNPTEILNKLLLFSKHNPHTRAVVNRIFNRLGITEEDVTNGDWASKTKDPFFLNALLSGLENFRVDYLFIHRNNDGEVYVYSASQRDDANTQIDTWGQAYINIYKKYQDKVKDVDGVLLKEKAIDFLNYFESYVSGNYIKSISDVELAEAAKELRADLMKYTGVILSSQYLAYTILQNTEIKTQKQLTLLEAYSNVESLTSTNIQYMITAIDADRSIFSTDDLGSGRILKKISMANAEFDETIGASVFKNPNGDLVYAHQKSSFHLKTMILLNNQDTLDELKKDEFLTKNWLLNNEAFYELARNKGLKVTRISGFKQGRINQTEEGIEESGSIGKTYGDLTPREFLNVLINSYPGLFNKYTGKLANTVIIENENNEKEEVALAPILIRVLESSNTGDLTYLPVIKAVEYNKQGVPVLTEKALQGFINNIISEFERVKKNVNPETRDQRDIKNYNEGKKRAQKFGKNRYILTPITQKNNIITKKSNLRTSEKQLLNLKAGNQRILIYDNKTASKVLKYTTTKEERDVVISSANKKSKSKPLETKIVSLGRVSIIEPSTFLYYVDLFGNSVVTQENKKKLTGSTIHSIKFGNTTLYTHSKAIADFLQGEAMYVYMTKEEYAKQEQDIVNDQQTSTETQQTEQFYEGNIELEPNTIFVFGSNPEGRHGAGAAKIARKQFGAIYGQGEGLQGNAYALPTKDLRVKKNKGYKSISPEKIIDSIKKLYETAKQNSDKQFKVAYRNTTKKSLNGYTGLEMIEMFNAAGTIPSNVIFSKEWFDTGKLNLPQTEDYVSFEDYAGIDQDVEDTQETEIASDPKMLKDWATEIETIITENNDLSFEEVIEELGGMEEFKAFLTNRLEKEFEKFLNEMSQISANNLLSPYVMQGLKNADGNKTNEVNLSNNLLNLTDDFNYNLKQIFFNDWLNTSALNQILLGDRALILKDSTDEIKRAKSSNASGDTAATAATAEEFGIMHETKHISLFAFDDPINSKSYGEGSNVEIADGQTFGTIKAFKHFWFGLGKLTPKQARLLQRIERGEKISHSEIFNSAEGGKSYAKMQAMLNSKKFVYDDGMIYDKTSIFFLTKEYTSLYIDGKWVPKPNRIALHNLRESMEKFEEKEWSEGRGTLALAAPTSALKKLKMNVQKFEDATSGKEFLVDNRMDMDANYMRLQTINPSNKIEITDPNQVKSLITAEQKPDTEVIIDGKSFTIKEITDAYNNILKNRDLLNYTNKRNLIFSFDLDKANQLLDKSKKANSLQPELYSFLMYAASALKASNAVSNIIEMFSVDENGQQKYNLNNPQTVLKFEQLFLSFFAKGAMSSKIPGVSLALVSDMGVRVYRKVYSVDENGMPDKQEIIRENTFHRKYDPSVIEYNIDDGPNQGDDANLKNLAKAIENSKEGYIIIVDRLRSNLKEYDKNGKYTGQRYTELIMPTHDIKVGENIENVNRNIPKFISKMFAVRIPSQDKHSFMNIKWVDFMPNYYGSSAVVARELIEISGADFDIDKLYVHIKEWFYEGGLFYEYGNVDNDQEGYKHYIKSVSKKVKKQGSIYAAAVDKFNKKNPSGLTNNVLEYVNSKNISKDVAKAVIQLGLPLTYNDYISYRNQYEEEPYPEAMNNKILDYKYALLGNEHIAATENRNVAIHHEPADTDPLTDLLNELSETIPYFENLNIEEDVDIDNLMNKMKAFEANKAGANSIGAVVLPNLYLSLLKEYKISLPVIRDEKSGELLTKNLVLNDTLYKDFGGEYAGVDVKGEPYRKQYLISALITAMTDNAKLRLSAKLGLNKDALAVVANMVALGVPLKTSILLINNPLIQELYFRAINKEAPTDPGIKKLTEVQLGLLSDLFDRSVNKKNIPLVTNVNDDLLEYLIQANMNSKNLIENFESEKDPELISAAYSVLEQFYTALQIKNYTGHLGSVLSHTKGPGKRYTDVLRKEKDAESLGLHLTNSEYRDYTNSRIKNGEVVIDVRPILKNTWQGSMHDIFVEIKDKLLPRVFLTRTEMFMNMYNKFIKNIDSRQVSDEDLEKFRLDLLSYLTIKAYMQHLELSGSNMIGSLSNSILYPQLEGKKITELISNLREKDSNNFFLKYFVIAYEANDENNNYGINAAMANTFVKLNDSAKLKIQSDLVKLYMDPYSRDSVIELIHYIMVKDGMSYNYGTLLDAVTPFIYERYLEQIKGVENAFLNYNETNIINTFGVDMDTLTKDFIMGYLQSNKMRFKLKNFLAGLVTIKSDINSVREFTLKDVQENPDTLYIYADPNLNAKFGIMTNVLRIPYRRNSNNKELISDDYIGKFKEEFLKFIKNNDKIKKYKKIIYLDNLIPDYKLLKQKSPKIAEAMSDILRQINIDLDKNLGSRYVYVYNTPVTNKLIIDLYPEKNTEIGSVKGYGSERKGLKLTGKKLEAKNRKINKSLIKANIKINNLEFVSYGNKNTGEVFEIEIPYVLKVGDSITERYTHFKLVSYSTSKKAKDKNEDFITANYAEYEEFQPEGAFSQWSGGFMFGERPSGKEIKDFIENKNGEEYLDFDEPDFDLDDIDALIDSIPQEIIDQKAQSVSEKNPEEESDIIDFDDVDIDVEAPSDVFIKTLKAKNKIKGFLNELTPEQIKKLNKTAEDLFQEFNNTSVTIEEFIENLKNCHI